MKFLESKHDVSIVAASFIGYLKDVYPSYWDNWKKYLVIPKRKLFLQSKILL